eukprot:gene24481-32933_t
MLIGQIYSLTIRDPSFDSKWLLSPHNETSEPHIRINVRTTMNFNVPSNKLKLSLPIEESDDQYDAWTTIEDPSIIFSPQSSGVIVNGVVDIIMHPVYNIPSPFMRFFDDSGAVFDHRHTESICCAHRSQCCRPSELPEGDNRYHEFGRVILDNHPFFGTPFFSLHLCNASELLSTSASFYHYARDIDIDNRVDTTTASERPIISHDDDLMAALNWLSLFAPHIGLPFSPSIYSQILNNWQL